MIRIRLAQLELLPRLPGAMRFQHVDVVVVEGDQTVAGVALRRALLVA